MSPRGDRPPVPADPPLVLTMGDPAGIGPELACMAWLARRERALAPFVLIADPDLIAGRARDCGLELPIVTVASPADGIALFDTALPIFPIGPLVPVVAGQPDSANAGAICRAIETAVSLVQSGQASAVVTNPIAKHVLTSAGFRHPGHTEYLAALAAPGSTPPLPVMMLWSPSLAVVPVTIHVPLADVPRLLTTDLLLRTGRIVARDLRERFGIAEPRLVFAGLNPHAGENGTMGREDDAIIAPAVRQLQAEGIAARGPYPADTLFHERARAGYDAALCMYHDQALIPIKTIAFDDAVNVTLGLPFIRTSPDHGTAFDIAGKGIARPDSLIAAIKLAERMASTAASRTLP